jgi:hypothetical protein
VRKGVPISNGPGPIATRPDWGLGRHRSGPFLSLVTNTIAQVTIACANSASRADASQEQSVKQIQSMRLSVGGKAASLILKLESEIRVGMVDF